MKHISKYTYLVIVISYISMPMIVLAFFMKWLSGCGFYFHQLLNPYFPGELLFGDMHALSTMPSLHRLLGMFIDGVYFGLLCMIFVFVIMLMKCIQRNDIFSSTTIVLFSTLSKLMFYLALYAPLSRIVLSVITTLHNEPGHRMIGLSFYFSDLLSILLFGFLMVITIMMHEGHSLKDEQKLTV